MNPSELERSRRELADDNPLMGYVSAQHLFDDFRVLGFEQSVELSAIVDSMRDSGVELIEIDMEGVAEVTPMFVRSVWKLQLSMRNASDQICSMFRLVMMDGPWDGP